MGDNINDHFALIRMKGTLAAKISLTNGWNGADQPKGIYYWNVYYTDFNSIASSIKGDVTLINKR